jgi:putative serine protease PepD
MTRFTSFLSSVGLIIAAVAVVLATTSCGSDAARSAATQSTPQDPRSTSTPQDPRSTTTSDALTVRQIYTQDTAGVVDIKVTSSSGSQETQGEGAGVVFDAKGDILTDDHVVTGATSIKVTFADGHQVSAKPVGTDPSTDVGVIHVDAVTAHVHPIPFADSADAEVGDPVVAIGSPFGLPETVTSGIVSAVGRSITAPNGYTITGAIQTDAPINPGNSGGPLLDGKGDVLGLADQIETDTTGATGQGQSSGVGFATASNMVAHVANELIAGHRVEHAYVGAFLDPATTGGAQITSVEAGSPASRAGLRRGDLITAVDDKPITSTQQFIETVATDSPGQTISVKVKRAGKTINITLQLGTQPRTQPNG